MTTQHTTTYHHDDEAGNETTFLVTFSLTPGDPGHLTGPPEHCYPPSSPELEIESVCLHSTSTPDSRGRKRFRILKLNDPAVLADLLEEVGGNLERKHHESLTYAAIRQRNQLMRALASGGFIGPEQFHPPTDLLDLLSPETLDEVEAACWQEIESWEPDEPDYPDEPTNYDYDWDYWKNCK